MNTSPALRPFTPLPRTALSTRPVPPPPTGAPCLVCDTTGECPVCGGDGECELGWHPSGTQYATCLVCRGGGTCGGCEGAGVVSAFAPNDVETWRDLLGLGGE
jgi:hypothetical protein